MDPPHLGLVNNMVSLWAQGFRLVLRSDQRLSFSFGQCFGLTEDPSVARQRLPKFFSYCFSLIEDPSVARQRLPRFRGRCFGLTEDPSKLRGTTWYE